MVELPFAITREALARDPCNRETLNCTTTFLYDGK